MQKDAQGLVLHARLLDEAFYWLGRWTLGTRILPSVSSIPCPGMGVGVGVGVWVWVCVGGRL